jgi:hypothetical protein
MYHNMCTRHSHPPQLLRLRVCVSYLYYRLYATFALGRQDVSSVQVVEISVAPYSVKGR